MTAPDPAAIARGINPSSVPILRHWPGEPQEWQDLVILSQRYTGDSRASHRKVVRPLLERDLLYERRTSSFDPTTSLYTPRLYDLTPLGESVRAELEKEIP